jgi:hypothetical protein
MDSAARVHDLLKNGEAKVEAAQLAVDHDVHTLMGKLKALYERVYGAIALDIHDWHWQAKALKNHVENEGVPTDDPKPATEPGETVSASELQADDAEASAAHTDATVPVAPVEPVTFTEAPHDAAQHEGS